MGRVSVLHGRTGPDPGTSLHQRSAMRDALADAAVRARLAQLYLEPTPGTPATIRRTYEGDSAVWGAFIRRRGLRLD